jgi:hypothetical protein
MKPAMITQPDSLLIGLSSPCAKRGLLYDKYRDHSAATIPMFWFGRLTPPP